MKVFAYGIVAILVLLVGSSRLHAQENEFKRFAVFVEGGYSTTHEDTFLQNVGGRYDLDDALVLGFGLEWFLTAHWSVEASAIGGRYYVNMVEGHYAVMDVLRKEIPLGRVWLIPVNLSVKYHLMTTQRLKPFIAVGRSFMLFDKEDAGWAADAVTYHSRAGFHLGGGLYYDLGARWFVRLNARYFLTEYARIDPDFTSSENWVIKGRIRPNMLQASLGIGFRF